jgi:mannitol/fructose-specific phosphotransferase system IIA component (Ntr-type)
VRAVRLEAPWEENWSTVRQVRFSRYPVLESGQPIGVLHVKDLVFSAVTPPLTAEQLRRLARPCQEMREDLPLEEALMRFRRRYDQMAIVRNSAGEWTGIITVEDVLEEIVGKIGDEFDPERADHFTSLADALMPGRVIFQLRAQSMQDAIREIVQRILRQELPVDPVKIIEAVQRREQTRPTYLGNGLAIPHARLDGIERPMLAFARSDEGVPVDGSNERAELIFLLLTPSSMARLQPRLLADIVGLFESEYVVERLHEAQTPAAVIEAVRAGQEVAID